MLSFAGDRADLKHNMVLKYIGTVYYCDFQKKLLLSNIKTTYMQ